jgi:DNA polymerase-2
MHSGFVVQPTYRIREDRPVVQLFGRLESGEAFLVEDDRFRPYFFVPKQQEAVLAAERDIRIEATDLRDLRGREVVRVTARLPSAVPHIRNRLLEGGCEVLEGDIRFAYRYLIDRGIRGAVAIDGPHEVLEDGLLRFRNPEIHPSRGHPALRTLSLDLETSPDASRIFSAALVGCDVEEVHLVSKEPVEGAQDHPDERLFLAGVMARIRELDPDIVVGWNLIDFDLRVLAARCQSLHLACRLGRIEGEIRFQREPSFARQSRAEIPGRMVLDGIPLVRDAVRLQDYRLETAARSLLGRGKRIDSELPDAAAEIARMYREEPEALVEYNLEDARLVLEILEKEGLLELSIERSLLSGMQLDRVGASIASFDLIYIPELTRRGVVAPSVDEERKTEMVRGGALLEPKPGLYANVAVFDFKSLYPSLIRTFNLDPLANARAGEAAIEAPNGARFSRTEAILPEVIQEFTQRRDRAKESRDRKADQAIKIMMNALFGVLGAASCRFFNPEIANAITSFGQQTLHWTREAFEREGVQVLYGDTDSVFVQLHGDERAEAEMLRDGVQSCIAARIRREYRVEPQLELELEKIFERLLLPRVRGGSGGSKKRYAGWVDGGLLIVGLESVRRDWPQIAHRLQEGMLERLFTDREVIPFVKQLVERMRAGELDDELVYVKRIRKGSLDRYTATTPPHIRAARKVGRPVGPVIRYVITRDGPEPVLPGRPLPAGIDRRHYVERVLRPVADGILSETGQRFDEALGVPQQLKLV